MELDIRGVGHLKQEPVETCIIRGGATSFAPRLVPPTLASNQSNHRSRLIMIQMGFTCFTG